MKWMLIMMVVFADGEGPLGTVSPFLEEERAICDQEGASMAATIKADGVNGRKVASVYHYCSRFTSADLMMLRSAFGQ